MNSCEDYQVNLSAMMDGELRGMELADTVAHLSKCQTCMEEFRKFQSLQERIDAEIAPPPVPYRTWHNIAEAAEKPKAKIIPLHSRFVRIAAAAAALLIFFGLGFFLRNPSIPMVDQNAPIMLASDRGSMDDDRFLALTRELLSSDPEYHRKMYFILHTLQADYYEGSYEPPEEETGTSPQMMQVDDSNNQDVYKF